MCGVKESLHRVVGGHESPYARGMRNGKWVVVVLLLALCLVGVACAPKGGVIDAQSRTPVGRGDDGVAAMPVWFPRAVDVRVHPATRYVVDRGELILEARIELLDQAGEPIKGVGQFICEIGAVDAAGEIETVNGRLRLIHFDLDVMTPEEHAEYWDPVARAYVLPLKVGAADADLAGGLTRMWVSFRPAWPGSSVIPEGEGRRDSVDVRVDW